MCDYVCYILKSGNRTYNGSTNNMKRRLRQHNGEIKGGAKATRGKGPWEVYCIVSGFTDKIEALQTEWKIKTVEGRRRPSKYNKPEGRVKGLNNILQLDKFTSNCKRDICDMNLTIYIQDEYKNLLNVPDNMKLDDISNYMF